MCTTLQLVSEFNIHVFRKYASISGLDVIWFIGRDNAT